MDTAEFKQIDLSEVILHRILAVNSIDREPTKHLRFNRTNYALSIKLEGETIYSTPDTTYISDPNHLILISKDIDYTYTPTRRGRCIMIEFEGEIAEKFDFYTVDLSDTLSQDLIKKFLNIAEMWDSRRHGYILKCKALFYRILDKLNYESESHYIPQVTKNILTPAVNYIHMNYSDPNITNESLAALADISCVYFRKLFTKTYGDSPIRYLRKTRINKAKELLIGETSSVSDIAEMVGYPNVYTFSRVFKAETGLSPTTYTQKIYTKFNK